MTFTRGLAFVSPFAKSLVTVVMLIAGAMPAYAVTRTWDGGVTGTDTDLGIAANWSDNTLPIASTGDIMEWNNTVTGPLTLSYTTSNTDMGASGGTNMGLNLSMSAAQSSALTILPLAPASNPLRMNGVTIAAGAGAFTIGDGSTSNITLGTSGNQTHTWINNSSNTATIASGVVFGLGGGGTHQVEFSGSGTWAVNNTIGGAISLRAIGSGVVNFSGNYTTASAVALHVAGTTGVPVFNALSGSTIALNNGGASVLISNLAANTTGVFNQAGGNVSTQQNVLMGSSGATNYGFYNKTAGTLMQTGTNRFRIGQGGGAGSAMLFYQSGGATNASVGIALNDTAGTTAGTGGAAVFYVNADTMTSTAGTLGSTTTGLGIGGRQGRSEVSVSQTGAIVLNGQTSLGGSVAGTPAAGDAGRVAVLNLGAGTSGGSLQTSRVVLDANNAPLGYLNFNGGTLKAQTANATFLTGLTQATVHSAGGTIDNSGVAITVGQNMVAPAGSGVTNISVSGATGYKGAPFVQITGGTSTTPATAVANLDGSGNVASITITNPGSGYTGTPTVTLVGGGGTAGTLTPTVAAVASGGMTFKGSGTTMLVGACTYTGSTKIEDFGKLVVGGSLSSPVSLNAGTLDGTGSVGATTIADDASNHLANGNGATGALTLSSLTFAGDAVVDVRTASPGLIVTGAMTTTPVNGTVTINPTTTTGIWANGPNNLISFGSLSGAISNFTLGTVTGTLNSRQFLNGLVLNGNNIALQIDGDSPKWTGLDNGNWVVGATGVNKNWKLITGGDATDYIDGDAVLFDDSATGTTAVDISGGSVSPTSTIFNDSTKDYTIAGSAGGIAGSGILIKNGSRSVTISASNSYSGLTTINAGTLTLSGTNSNNGGTLFNGGTLNANSASALGSGTLTIAAGSAKTLNNTSGGAITMTDNIAQSWNDDFAFTGSSNLDMGTGVVTLGGAGTARTVTLAGGVLGVGRIASTAHGLTLAGSGTLQITTTAASNINGALNVGSGSKLRINTGIDAGTTNDFIATSLTGSGTIENGGGVERWLIVDGTTDSTFSGLLQDGSTGPLGLSKRGTSIMTISTSNPFTGATTINGGTLKVTGALSATSGTTIGAGGSAAVLQVSTTQAVGANQISFDGTGNASTARLELSNSISLSNNISLPQRNNTTVAIQNISGNNTLSGAINVIAGGNNARIQSDAGLLTLSGGLGTSTAATRTVTLQGAGNGLVTGAISNGAGGGAINIAKEGAGTWTLAGNDTYTGTTAVSGGTLLVTGSHTGAGAVSVASGGTIGGTGTIDTSATNAGVTVAVGGSLSPGTSAGTLTFTLGTGSLDVQLVNSGGFKFELGDPNTPSASDRVVLISGTLIAGTLDFSDFAFSTLSGAAAGQYKLFNASSPMAATLGTIVSGPIGSFTGTLSLDTTNFDVLLTLAGGGLAGDYNNDGKVNAADYVLWRKNPGAFGGPGGYNTWRANFGNPPGSGSALGGAGGAVPEPGTYLLLFLGSVAMFATRRFRA